MTLQDRKRHKEVELVGIVVGPQHLPQADDLVECEFALERDEDPAKDEE